MSARPTSIVPPAPPRSRWSRRALWALAAAGGLSLWMHVLLGAFAWLWPRVTPNGGDVLGEHGNVGAGGPELEISMLDQPDPGPPAAPPTPPAPLATEAPAPAAPPRPAHPAQHEKHAKGDDGPQKPDVDKKDEKDEKESPADEGVPPQAAPRPLAEALPKGAESLPKRSSGRAAGDANSISAQRGRLSKAVECDDPIQGVWVGSKYLPQQAQWYIFTLSMRRNGSSLAGTINSHFWHGFSAQSRPPVCADGLETLDAIVTMSARGSVDSGGVHFRATGITRQKVLCESGEPIHYNLDRFDGPVDEATHEFHSISTDDLSMIDEPILLRRTACLD